MDTKKIAVSYLVMLMLTTSLSACSSHEGTLPFP